MRFASLGHPTTVGALHAGECFAFDWHGRAQLGIKIVDEFAAHPIASCVALWPGSPEHEGRPGFLDELMAPGTGVYGLADAMLVPSTELSLWHVSTDIASQAGVIVLARDRMMMGVTRKNGKVVFIDLAAGKTVMLPDNTTLLRIGGWRLMQKVFEKYETLCTYRAPE